MKTGLVIEGGGVRGIYAAGVLDVFLEAGMEFDGVIGVSAGAIHGCSYLSRQKGRSLRYYKRYCNDPRFMSLRSLLTTGDLVGEQFCYHDIPDRLDVYDHAAFFANPAPFYVTCTNVETGRAEHIRMTDMAAQIDCLRASASLPYVSRMVEIDGRKYLDGGIADSVPLRAFEGMGYPRNVVIRTRPSAYRKKPELQALPALFYRDYPAFAAIFANRHRDYNLTAAYIAERERQGAVFVIAPKEPLDIGRLEKNPENVQRTYDRGYADATELLPRLKKWRETGREP